MLIFYVSPCPWVCRPGARCFFRDCFYGDADDGDGFWFGLVGVFVGGPFLDVALPVPAGFRNSLPRLRSATRPLGFVARTDRGVVSFLSCLVAVFMRSAAGFGLRLPASQVLAQAASLFCFSDFVFGSGSLGLFAVQSLNG